MKKTVKDNLGYFIIFAAFSVAILLLVFKYNSIKVESMELSIELEQMKNDLNRTERENVEYASVIDEQGRVIIELESRSESLINRVKEKTEQAAELKRDYDMKISAIYQERMEDTSCSGAMQWLIDTDELQW